VIYASPSRQFVAELDGAPQGLVGTLQAGIFLEPAGTAVQAYSASGITEEVTGASTSSYYVTFTAPALAAADGTKYVVKWKNGTTIIPEDLIVSAVMATLLAPSGSADGLSFGELVAELIALTGLSPERAKSRINQAYRRFAMKSEVIRAKVDLGTSVNSENAYDLDRAIIGVYDPVRYDGKRLERKSADEIDDLGASQAYIVGRTNGFYAPEFDAVGGGRLLLWPTPTAAGKTITARVSLRPAAMVDDGEYPLLPAEFHDTLTEGAFAMSLGRDDERFQDRQAMLAEFDSYAAEAKAQLNRRVGSGGIARMRLTR
jgi:hypothetical protein